LDEVRQIHFAFYVAENETEDPAFNFDIHGKPLEKDKNGQRTNVNQICPPMHDMSFLPKSIPTDISIRQRNLLGNDLQTRFEESIRWYERNGIPVKSKIYKGANHRTLLHPGYRFFPQVASDILRFYYGNERNSFLFDEASAEKINMRFQLEREQANNNRADLTL